MEKFLEFSKPPTHAVLPFQTVFFSKQVLVTQVNAKTDFQSDLKLNMNTEIKNFQKYQDFITRQQTHFVNI